MGTEEQDQRRPEVRLSDDTIAYLRSHMRDAVSEGIHAAMTQEAAERFWSTGLLVLQKQATRTTGELVLGGLTSMAKKGFLLIAVAVLLYSVGGLGAVLKAWDALTR